MIDVILATPPILFGGVALSLIADCHSDDCEKETRDVGLTSIGIGAAFIASSLIGFRGADKCRAARRGHHRWLQATPDSEIANRLDGRAFAHAMTLKHCPLSQRWEPERKRCETPKPPAPGTRGARCFNDRACNQGLSCDSMTRRCE